MKRILLLALLCAFTFCSQLSAQTQLAGWTFETAATPASPNTPTTFAATLGTQNDGTANLYLNGSNGSSSWTQNGELSAFAGTTTNDPRATKVAGNALALINSSANGKAIVFKFSMANFKDPILTYAAQRTSSGFTTETWAYSLNGTSFTDIVAISGTSIPSAFGTIVQTVDMSTINTIDGAAVVYLRMTVIGATSSSGNNRLDNFVINATPAIPPTFTANYPKVERITTSSFKAIVNLGSKATVAMVVLPDGQPEPSSAQVKAGQDASNSPVASNFKASIDASATVSTDYSTIYFRINTFV